MVFAWSGLEMRRRRLLKGKKFASVLWKCAAGHENLLRRNKMRVAPPNNRASNRGEDRRAPVLPIELPIELAIQLTIRRTVGRARWG